jgi:hypothetical protein
MAELCLDSMVDENNCHLQGKEDKKFRRRASHPHFLYLRWHKFFENWWFSARHYLYQNIHVTSLLQRTAKSRGR